MRKNLLDQLPLTPATIDHVHAKELAAMSDLLDRMPEAVALVHEDLSWRGKRRVDPAKGRDGMAAEQVLRIGVLKQHTSASYERLAFGLADSSTYRSFCRIGFGQKPLSKSALQKNVKRVKPETWEAIQKMTVRQARDLGIEKGNRVRTDCMVVESNIHHPTDSSLLGDCVRVLTRLMKRAKENFGLSFQSHKLRAKRRVLEISNAKSMQDRTPLYRDLVKMTEKTLEQAQRMAEHLDEVPCHELNEIVAAQVIGAQIRQYSPLVSQILSQAERRVFRGESVPASEKIVSIFEPHTDIIIKGNRETEYGHKVCLTTGASSLVTDVLVEQGNPADSTLAIKMMERQRDIFGKSPTQASFDGGFATRANLTALRAIGIQDVVFHKRCGIEVEDMARSRRVYTKLRAFRAGIEGTISFLKRTFGLERCTWRGFSSFRAYVQCGVVACNLLVMARRVLAAHA
jgi:transposase, IS5 family